MFHTHVRILGWALALLWMGGCIAPTLPPGAVTMTCSQQEETPLMLFRGGHTTRTTCTRAKGPAGQEVAVRVRDSRVGHKLQCAEKEGKITCPDDPMPAFQPATTVTQ
jgi:hypothetical protein